MAIGGGKFFGYAAWIAKKKLQVFVRKYMSHVFAIALGALVLIRENESAAQRLARFPVLWQVLILMITGGTVAAALWELFGNKLTTSPQEVRFVRAMRALLHEMERFLAGKDREPNAADRLAEFCDGFLEIVCHTICGKVRIDGGLMIKLPGRRALKLVKSSKNAKYPNGLEVPLSGGTEEGAPGPAAVAYDRLQIVYMPSKKNRRGWLFRLAQDGDGERYEPSEPVEGWTPAPSAELEAFRSILCLPVAAYEQRNRKKPFGVLNLSTQTRDPFVDRDFMMGECFASVLAQAFSIAEAEALRQAEPSTNI